MNKTAIEWCDYTWNPIVGCSPVSSGCAHCYAAAISRRFGLPWGFAHFLPERLNQPAKVRKPGRVFVCSMADIGHNTVKSEWREAVYAAMRSAPWHTFIILTKRPGDWLLDVPAQAWVGVTAEDQANFDARWNLLIRFCARMDGPYVRFVSVEPMLAPVSCRRSPGVDHPVHLPQWVIAGPETGPKARRCDDAWIDALAEESPCFFDKRANWTRREFPANLQGADD